MWHEINTDEELIQFMNQMDFFHDSCIKEMNYLSGAYVCDDLSMFPLNNHRVLRVVIQRQNENYPMIEMEFQGLKSLRLIPVDENYTCEILESTMVIQDGDVYWCDCGCLLENNLDVHTGTLICASRLRWRAINGFMGEKAFYRSDM